MQPTAFGVIMCINKIWFNEHSLYLFIFLFYIKADRGGVGVGLCLNNSVHRERDTTIRLQQKENITVQKPAVISIAGCCLSG